MNTRNTSISNRHRSLYWTCQFIGWGLVSLYWAYRVITLEEYGTSLNLLNYVLDVAIGIGLTHGYRSVAMQWKWNTLKLSQLAIRIVPSIILLSGIFMLLNNVKWFSIQVAVSGNVIDLNDYLLIWDPILITGLRMMSIWVLAYHLYHFYHKEIHTAKTNAELKSLVNQAQLDQLRIQLNPHFLFNSLNSIKSLVIENPNTARRAIDLLSDLLRSSLYENEASMIPIKDELALVQDYITLEKLRFEERLELIIHMDNLLEHQMVPALSIQLLVENAIKHGIDKRIQGGRIHVSIKKEQRTCSICVQNPGTFEMNSEETGLGLQNLKKRLDILYQGSAHLSIKNEKADSVSAVISIPIESK